MSSVRRQSAPNGLSPERKLDQFLIPQTDPAKMQAQNKFSNEIESALHLKEQEKIIAQVHHCIFEPRASVSTDVFRCALYSFVPV